MAGLFCDHVCRFAQPGFSAFAAKEPEHRVGCTVPEIACRQDPLAFASSDLVERLD